MKKLKARIASVLIASVSAMGMCSAMPAFAADTALRLMGDMDGDYKITANDAQTTLDIYVESIVGNEDNAANAENGNGDIDMNGVIDVTDAQSILNYFCQTLVGGQPLWADFREVSYRGTHGEAADPTAENPFSLKGMYLEIGCAQGAPGETVEVPVYIAGVDELAGFQFFVKADERLTCTDITSDIGPEILANGEAVSDSDSVNYVITNPEYGVIVWAQAHNINPRDGFVIGTYHYTIPEDAEAGTVYQVRLNDEQVSKFIPKAYDYAYEFTLLEGVVVCE